MAETGNYQLNLWESADRIMREDFNADNAKVDAALAATNGKIDTVLLNVNNNITAAFSAAMKMEPIKTITASTTVSQMTIDVSDIDWSQWRCIILEAKLLPSNGTGTADLQVNGSGSGCAFWTLCAMSYQTNSMGQVSFPAASTILLLPLKDTTRTLSCVVLNENFHLGINSNVQYQALNQLSLVPYNNQFYANSSVKIFGIQ